MASFSQYHVRLFRDSFDTAWGFRLQGGKDLGQPLTIQRVFTGSPAEGELQRGDIIVSISERPSETLTHKQAQDLIKFGGGSISLAIKRPPPGRVNVAQPVSKPIQASGFRPQKSQTLPRGKMHKLGGHGPDFGSDYSRVTPQYGPVSPNRAGTGRNMLFQVQQSMESRGFGGQYDPDSVITTSQYTPMKPSSQQFQNLINEEPYYQPRSDTAPVYQSFSSSMQYHPGPPEVDDDDYEVVPVSQRKKAFMGDEPRKWASHHIVRAPRPAPKPRSPLPPSSGPDFGLDYAVGITPKWNAPVQSSRGARVSPQPMYTPQNRFIPTSERIEQEQANKQLSSAWSGSLRQTGVKQYEDEFSPASYQSAPPTQPKPAKSRSVPKKQQVRTAQPFNPAPRNIPISTPQGGEEGPKVVHLQYNSPMGLYSNENVQETLDGQTQAMVPQQGGKQGDDGPRDWSQSALCRLIQQDDRRSGGGAPARSSSSTTIQSHQQVHGMAFHPVGHDIGASDF